jgi:lipoprotein LprG
VRTAYRRRPAAGLLAGLAALALVSACSGGSSDNGEDPATRLTNAKSSLDHAEYIGFTLSTDNLPDGVYGLVNAEGTGTHEPAFTGDVDVKAKISISAPLIAVDGDVYAKLPIVGWQQIDPADYGAPDPAQLMDTDSGLSSLFTATVGPATGSQVRDGDDVFDTVEGTIPGSAVQSVFPSAGDGDFDVTYSLTGDDAIHGAEVTGPFYGDSSDVTYRITFDLDADSVDIQPPS